MARKRDRNRAPAPGKPVALADDSFKAGLEAELRRQQRPAFKARLAAAESGPRWQQFKQQFERIAAEERVKQAVGPSVPLWKNTITKYAPAPPLWSGKGRAWLLGDQTGFVKYRLQPGEKVWAPRRHDDYCRRIEREAHKAGLPSLTPSYIKTVYLDHLQRAKKLLK